MRPVMTDAVKKRNVVSLRLDDAEAKKLIDLAWTERKRTAVLIRELVSESLQRRAK